MVRKNLQSHDQKNFPPGSSCTRWCFLITTANRTVFFTGWKGKVEYVDCCRLCLRFEIRDQMSKNDGLLEGSVVSEMLQNICKTTYSQDELFVRICEECHEKMTLLDSWIEDVRVSEYEYQFLVDAIGKKVPEVKDNPLEQKDSQQSLTLNFEVEPLSPNFEGFPEEDLKMEFEVDSADEMESDNKNAINLTEESKQLEKATDNPKEKSAIVKIFRYPPNIPGKRGREAKPKPKNQIKLQDAIRRKCNICNQLFETPDDLMAHLTEKHTQKGQSCCTLCDKSFTTLTAYNRHLGLHDTSERPKVCSFCPVGFKTLEALQNHENKNHGTQHEVRAKFKSQVLKYQCTNCDRGFRSKYDLEDHDRYIHQKLPGAVCKLCGKGFRSRSSLRKHHLTHTRNFPFACHSCDKAFRDNCLLQKHLEKRHPPEATVAGEVVISADSSTDTADSDE
ncbi:zinc finger protein 700-like isoform X2 [Uranotaenia lowii]|uniref:zinc finger protein 700-like isoform X2 n=1 Tax=Uranotaenia lowii TaxID=190385 RepID=UPI00247AC832|nr:zinc finger protein 700-like isoform X2 [Uranotaenia lowii]